LLARLAAGLLRRLARHLLSRTLHLLGCALCRLSRLGSVGLRKLVCGGIGLASSLERIAVTLRGFLHYFVGQASCLLREPLLLLLKLAQLSLLRDLLLLQKGLRLAAKCGLLLLQSGSGLLHLCRLLWAHLLRARR
jgi:hypothetical protein